MQLLVVKTIKCEECGEDCELQALELDNNDEYERDKAYHGQGTYWQKTIKTFVCQCGWYQ